jgi:hypothetical protein
VQSYPVEYGKSIQTEPIRRGGFLAQSDWIPIEEPDCLAADRVFHFREALRPPTPTPVASDGPLVSCIMPTANRRAFVGRAIAQFLAQDYPRRELIVVDDGEMSVANLIPDHKSVHYLQLRVCKVVGGFRLRQKLDRWNWLGGSQDGVAGMTPPACRPGRRHGRRGRAARSIYSSTSVAS